MSAGGFEVKAEPLFEFSKHLDQLESDLRGSADMVGSCVADVSLFGLVGQLFGAGASMWCGKARDQLGSYATTLGHYADKTTEAAKKYQAGETDAIDSLRGFDV